MYEEPDCLIGRELMLFYKLMGKIALLNELMHEIQDWRQRTGFYTS